MVIDTNQVLTLDTINSYRYISFAIDQLITNLEIMAELLSEVEPSWLEYNNMGYCTECCRLTDAALYHRENPKAKYRPHTEWCVHLRIEEVLAKRRG